MGIQSGSSVLHYRIIEKLGEGGMGIVYKAQDTKLGRFVALKFLSPHLTASEEDKQRFIHEAQAASILQHNNICAIHEINETEDGQLFICMDYYQGENLQNKAMGEKAPIEEAVDYVVQIGDGLGRAHEKGMVHRDIKPANIIITADGVAKILDFGLAKLSNQTKLTKEGTTLGTIAYMSPEQTRGEEVDLRTDIWSLGVIFYEMLTGQLPFKGNYDQAVIYSILNEIPVPVTKLRKDIPVELQKIVDKMLKKNPDERYQTMIDLLSDLRTLSSALPAKATGVELSAPKKIKSKKTYAYVALAAILIPLVLYLGHLFTADSSAIESIAILPLDNLSGQVEQEYFVDGMTDALISELAQISALRVISRTSVMQYKEVKKPIQDIARELNVDALVEGTVLYDNNQIRITVQLIQAFPEQHLWASDYKRELQNVIELQKEVARSIAHEINITVTPEEQLRLTDAPSVDPEAYELYLRGYHYFDTATQDGLEKSIDLYNQALKKDPNFARANAGLAESYLFLGFRKGFPGEALAKFQQSAEKAIALDNKFADTHRLLAMIKFFHEWDPIGAESELKKAIQLNPNSAAARDLYSQVLLVLRRFDEALLEREKTYQLDPLSHVYHCNGGFTYYASGRFDKAIEQARATSEQFGSACSAEDLVIGMAYNQKAMYENAIVVLEKRRDRAQYDPRLITEIGYAFALSGQVDQAKKIIAELDEIGIKKRNLPYYYLSAIIYNGLGDKDEVFSLLEKSYENREWFFLWLDSDIRFDDIRSDPRYRQLVRNLNFIKT